MQTMNVLSRPAAISRAAVVSRRAVVVVRAADAKKPAAAKAPSMSKADLIEKVAQKTGLTKKAAGDAVSEIFDSIEDALISGQSFTLVGFGSFKPKERAARKGVNPQTKAKIDIPARIAPTFTASKVLKDHVSGVTKKVPKVVKEVPVKAAPVKAAAKPAAAKPAAAPKAAPAAKAAAKAAVKK